MENETNKEYKKSNEYYPVTAEQIIEIKKKAAKNLIKATLSNKIIIEQSETESSLTDRIKYINQEFMARQSIENDNHIETNSQQNKELQLLIVNLKQRELLNRKFAEANNSKSGIRELIKMKHLYIHGKGDLSVYGVYPENEKQYGLDVANLIDNEIKKRQTETETTRKSQGKKIVWTGTKAEFYRLIYDMWHEHVLLKGTKEDMVKLIVENFTTITKNGEYVDFGEGAAKIALQEKEGEKKRSKKGADFSELF